VLADGRETSPFWYQRRPGAGSDAVPPGFLPGAHDVFPAVPRARGGRAPDPGLPGLLPGVGFSLPGAGQLGLGSTNRRGLLTGLIAFGPCGLSDPGGLGGQPVGAGQGGFRLGAGTGGFLSQLPPGLRGFLTSTASLTRRQVLIHRQICGYIENFMVL
jgi:hypothetical protein